MAFVYRNPMFAIPWTLNTTVTVTFTAGLDLGPVTIGGASTTVWTDRRGGSEDPWAVLVSALNTADAGNGTWSQAERATDYRGRLRLTCDRSAGDGRTISEVQFADANVAALFGFTSSGNAPDIVGNDQNFDAPRMGYGQWVTHTLADLLMAELETRQLDEVAVAESPDGTSTVLDFGGVERKIISLIDVPPAMVLPYYAEGGEFADDDWMTNIGGPVGDTQAAFDTLRRQVLTLGDGQYLRFYPDQDTPATYVDLAIGREDTWIRGLSTVASRFSSAPLAYAFTITGNEVG